jgi:hypothetical protein
LGENGRISKIQEKPLFFQGAAIDEHIKAAHLQHDEEGHLCVLEYKNLCLQKKV